MLSWFKGAFDWQPLKAGAKLLVCPASASGPITKAQGFIVERQHAVTRRITALRVIAGPSTVARFVVAVVVDAVEFVSGRARTHVSEESRETGSPFRAYGYPAPSVSRIPLGLWIRAALNHVFPRDVFSAALAVYRGAMCHGGCAPSLYVQAAAALGSARPQILAYDGGVVSALASTPPHQFALRARSLIRQAEHRQTRKHAASEVVKGTHYGLPSMWASTIRLTSSAMEMPSRLASRFKYARCGSVKEIICFVTVFTLKGFKRPSGLASSRAEGSLSLWRHRLMAQHKLSDDALKSPLSGDAATAWATVRVKVSKIRGNALQFQVVQMLRHLVMIPQGIQRQVAS